MFESIVTSTTGISGIEFIICSACSLVFGLLIALIHMYRNNYSKNLILSLVLLPVTVQAVIMLVNGNLGTGVAVMGAFSLIRFRSTPGNAREITSVFFAMTAGLAMAMGYVAIAAVLVILVGAITILLTKLSFGEKPCALRELKITIPENLDYEGIFDDLFEEYTLKSELMKVKTVNMGSLYELHYSVTFRKNVSVKSFLDAIRCRNGNLGICCGRAASEREEL